MVRKFFTLLFIIAALFGSASTIVYADDSAKAKSTANSIYRNFKNAYGSSSAIKSNAIAPLMDSNHKMATLNGQTQFNAQIECPSSTAFLQITLLPQSTNDFYALISQDPQLTGRFTYSVRTPLISGVCTRGFISCTAGTWSNCAYYEWTIDSNGNIGWTNRLTPSDLGTCFCTNSHCGGNVFQQFEQIANTFGAGLAGFIAQIEHFAISNVSARHPTLTYYGQDSKRCTLVSGKDYSGYSADNPTNYYDNPSTMSSDKASAASNQENNENSPYYSVINSEYLNKTTSEVKTCEIKRDAQLADQSWITTNGEKITPSCQSLEKTGNNLYKCQFLNSEGKSCSLTEQYWVNGEFYVYLYSPDDFYGYVKIGDKIVYSRNDGTTGGKDPVTYQNTFTTTDKQLVTIHVQNNGECNGAVTAKFFVSLRRYEKVSEVKTDSCSNINTKGCRLRDEIMCNEDGKDCVYTVKDYNSTGVDLLENCKTLYDTQTGLTWLVCVDGSSMTYSISSDAGLSPSSGALETGEDIWWYVKKVYTCESKDITLPSLDREKGIVENGQYNSSSGIMSYPDTTTQSYGLGGYSGTYYLQATSKDYGNCQYTCIVVKNTVRTSVINNGQETTNAPPDTPTDQSTKRYYLPCKKTSQGTWYCPATGDEQIIQPCVCLDEGASSIAVMSALVDAARDLTCSNE